VKAQLRCWPIVVQLVIACTVGLALAAPFSPSLATLWVLGLPTAALIVLAAVNPAAESPRYRWGIVVALVFSQLGGWLLGRGQFVPGVLGYLAANLAYLTALTTGVRLAKRIAPFLVLGLYGGVILALGWRKIPPEHIVPVCLYAVSIVSVPAQAIGRAMTVPRLATCAAALGATLLLISDSAIAVERFYEGFRGAGLFIMATYFAGQWLIVQSVGRAGRVARHTVEAA
jgi:uncharacterized membrane protein YhhN